ncbi:MAG: hypothetical protein WC523_03670 [Patescibacteria group bacterium]
MHKLLMRARQDAMELAHLLTELEKNTNDPQFQKISEKYVGPLAALALLLEGKLKQNSKNLMTNTEEIDEEDIDSEAKMHLESLVALADKLDEAGQEGEANKIDEMLREMEESEPPMNDAEKLVKRDNDVFGLTEYNEDLEKVFRNKASKSKRDAFEKLASIADKLDDIGAPEEANLIDEFLAKHAVVSHEDEYLLKGVEDEINSSVNAFIKNPNETTKNAVCKEVQRYLDLHEDVSELKLDKNAAKKVTDPYDYKEHHKEQVRETKETKPVTEHHNKPYQETKAPTLSIRHCPDHIGVQLGRIGDGTYQCSEDGAIFNWETGWTGPDGKVNPGGSVAAQTPQSTEYGIPHRIFDAREKALQGATY